MKTKFMITLIAAAMMLNLTACDNSSSDKPIIDDDLETTNVSTDISETAESETSNDENYSNKVYYVGEDIPVGGYVVDCTSTDNSMAVIVFSSSEDYENFQNAKKQTVGEFNEAVELNAWANFYLEQGDKAYIGLREDYIILMDKGQCEFNNYSLADSKTIYSGVYVVGEDIDPEKINIQCTTECLQVTLFGEKDKYINYHKTNRFTVGEESDAIDKYSDSTDFIRTNDYAYANLKDGMVMLVEDGIGDYSMDKGPIVN